MTKLDYASYPRAAITKVMHPGLRVLMAVPRDMLSVYYRPDRSPAHTDAADPAWEKLRPWADVEREMAVSAESPAARRRRLDAEYHDAVYAWGEAVRATEWGRDPLWNHVGKTTDGATTDGRTGRAWFPRLRLLARYGTTSLAQYAARQGYVYPERQQ